MKSNRRTIYYIVFIVIFGIILLADICFKIFDNGTRQYLSFLTGFLFLLMVIIEVKKKNEFCK